MGHQTPLLPTLRLCSLPEGISHQPRTTAGLIHHREHPPGGSERVPCQPGPPDPPPPQGSSISRGRLPMMQLHQPQVLLLGLRCPAHAGMMSAGGKGKDGMKEARKSSSILQSPETQRPSATRVPITTPTLPIPPARTPKECILLQKGEPLPHNPCPINLQL